MSENVKIAPFLDKVTDFSDKLNPMLVKELRQGLRGMGFILLFIALQVLMVLSMVAYSSASSYDSSGENLSRTLFLLFSLAVLLVQPLRGITALSSEVKGKTIDLMVLTRLSAWRIVFGKWVSLVSQSALIFATLLPYMIMRYFFGGMQLFSEIGLLVAIFVASASLTAFAVGLSAISSVILRGIFVLIGGGFLLSYISIGIFAGLSDLIGIFSFSSKEVVYGVLAYFAVCAFLTWISLDFGASAIAPLAENRSTPRKLIGAGLILVASFSMLEVSDEAPLIMAMFLIVPLAMTALTEHAYIVPQVCVPFIRKGSLAKLSGRALYPGWATGVVYVLGLFVLYQFINMFTGFELFDSDEMHAIMINFFAMLLFPLVIIRMFLRKPQKMFGAYLAIMMFSWLLALIVYAIAESTNQEGMMLLFCWVPPMNLFGAAEMSDFSGFYIAISYLTTFGYGLIPLLTSPVEWKQMKAAEAAAQEIIDKNN